MKLTLVVVGRARRLLAAPIAEYETRVRRYFSLEVVEIKEHPGHHASGTAEVVDEEGKRILSRLPSGHEVLALDSRGESWSSERLAEHLAALALSGRPGLAFVIGGALGLSTAVLGRADRHLSLSAFTFPHEMARLILTEQLYRAGTILRNEPYHK